MIFQAFKRRIFVFGEDLKTKKAMKTLAIAGSAYGSSVPAAVCRFAPAKRRRMLWFRLVWQLPWRRLVRQVMFDDMAGNIPVFIRLCGHVRIEKIKGKY